MGENGGISVKHCEKYVKHDLEIILRLSWDHGYIGYWYDIYDIDMMLAITTVHPFWMTHLLNFTPFMVPDSQKSNSDPYPSVTSVQILSTFPMILAHFCTWSSSIHTIHITITRMDPYGHDQQMTRFMTRFIMPHSATATAMVGSCCVYLILRADARARGRLKFRKVEVCRGSDSCNMAVLSLQTSGQYEAKKLQVGKCISLLR